METIGPKSVKSSALLRGAALLTLLLSYQGFFLSLWKVWFSDSQFSFGILVPIIVSIMIWRRWDRLQQIEKQPWFPGFVIVLAGCGLQIIGSLSGTLLLSGLAFVLVLTGAGGFLWGLPRLCIIRGPLALLTLMVPLPSYLVDQLSWNLQAAASTGSSATLGFLGVPVFQDGNLLKIPNYVLEVKQACSGSRSIFALFALALVLGLNLERKWWIRTALFVSVPVLALGANIVRIVVTGLIARRWGNLAANEALHTAWGILVFLLAVAGLLGLQRLLQWAANEYA